MAGKTELADVPQRRYDGGPAFPVVEPDGPCGIYHGMTLRDYFAGQALIGLLANSKWVGVGPDITDDAYRYADSMLVSREKSEGI